MDIPIHVREWAEDFAEEYRLYVEGEQSLDRRKTNAVLADMASELIEELRFIDGKITTTRHNEKVIRTLPWSRSPRKIGSYGVEIDEVAYDAAALPADEMEEVIASWLVARAEEIARAEADVQGDMEADPDYNPM